MDLVESRAPLAVTAVRDAADAVARPLLLDRVATVDELVTRLVDAGADVAVAEQVSEGRGPIPHVPSGAALWAATTVEHDPAPRRDGWLRHAVALAAVDALRAAGRVPGEIVWPDRLSVPGAMCGGDAGTRTVGVVDVRAVSPTTAVATVGILVGLGMLELPRGTTSVYADGGDIDRTALLAAYLGALATRVEQWRADDPALALAYRDRCQTLGRLVAVDGAEGRVRSVDESGRLVVDVGGELHAVGALDPAPVLL